jgi:hypothetical protein
MRLGTVAAWALSLLTVAVSATAAPDGELARAASRLTQAASDRGLSAADGSQAVAVLQRLAGRGLPVRHALQVVMTAVERGRRGGEIGTLAEGVESAYLSGVPPQELVNLTRDLASKGVATSGIVAALRAAGDLAEDGYDDGETRRGLTLATLHALEGGPRGRPDEAVREEARESQHEDNARGGEGRDGAPGQDRAAEAHDRNELRDELRRNPPPGLSGDHPPGGVPQRGRRNNRGRNP